MHKIIVFAAAVFLTGIGVCLAQPPGITREMISRALPLEGAPKAEPGPYQVTSEPAFGVPGLQVYRPAALDAFPAKDTLPVVVWGNGGCGIDSKTFSGFLSTIVSHGVLVVSTVPVEGAARRQETADDMRAAIDWAEKENARAGSPLSGKIAIDKVAAMGTSCGGFLSLTLGADPRVKSIGVFNSGVQTPPAGQAQPPSTLRFVPGRCRVVSSRSTAPAEPAQGLRCLPTPDPTGQFRLRAAGASSPAGKGSGR